jgi:hypothetical protein
LFGIVRHCSALFGIVRHCSALFGIGPGDGTKWTTSIQPVIAESTYDWERDQWEIPLNFAVSQLIN